MLNRTLVLPTSWCYCDYDWTPHVLEKCKIRCGRGPRLWRAHTVLLGAVAIATRPVTRLCMLP